MPNHYVHIRLNATKGDHALTENEPIRVTLVADDYKSSYFLGTGKGKFEWVSARMTLSYGRQCYFEIVDRSRTGNIAAERDCFLGKRARPEGA
jgi:hypothetical protein